MLVVFVATWHFHISKHEKLADKIYFIAFPVHFKAQNKWFSRVFFSYMKNILSFAQKTKIQLLKIEMVNTYGILFFCWGVDVFLLSSWQKCQAVKIWADGFRADDPLFNKFKNLFLQLLIEKNC